MDGRLVSVEGISGVGKTTLTGELLDRLHHQGRPVTSLDGFSERAVAGHDLGRHILQALIDAADGDHFLRGGHPAAETLLLLAIKTYDYEGQCLPALRDGHLVIEGRSLHSIAVYQSLILHADDDRKALTEAHAILELASHWRPLPDLTLLLLDDVATAIGRLEHRDGTRCPPEQRRMHHRADRIFTQLADADPRHVSVVDQRHTAHDAVIGQMLSAITQAPPRRADSSIATGSA